MTTNTPTKVQLQIKPNDVQNAQTLAAVGAGTPVTVVAASTGAVTFLDKAKGYYKALITAVGAILVILNEVTPLTDFLPENQRHYVSVGVVAITTLANFLKSNEHWVDDL
jgi:hypothetical protein